MSIEKIDVEIRPTGRPGAVKAYADVTYDLPEGRIIFFGFAIVQKDGKPPFVGPPSRQGNVPGKYFPVIELEGSIHARFMKAILEAYKNFHSN